MNSFHGARVVCGVRAHQYHNKYTQIYYSFGATDNSSLFVSTFISLRRNEQSLCVFLSVSYRMNRWSSTVRCSVPVNI